MWLLLQTLRAKLNSRVAHIAGYVAGCLFGVLVLVQGANYFAARLKRYNIGRQQAASEARSTKAAAASATRYSRYQLDSAGRAADRRQLAREATLTQQADEALSTNRPPRVPLPEQPPRE